MNESQALEMVSKLAAFFPGVPAVTIAAYASELQDVGVGEMENAIGVFVHSVDRFPSLAEVRGVILRERPRPLLADVKPREIVPMRPENIEPVARDKIRAIFDAYFDKWDPTNVKRKRRRTEFYEAKPR